MRKNGIFLKYAYFLDILTQKGDFFMAKPKSKKYDSSSKYAFMAENQLKILEAFPECVLNTELENYKITDFMNPLEPSKSGKMYRRYKVQLENAVWISTQTLNKYVKRGYFSKRINDEILKVGEYARFDENINENFEENDLPIREVKEVDMHDFDELRGTYDLRELKQAYHKCAQKFHPDHGGDVEMFKLAKTIYDVRKCAIEEISEFCPYGDSDFEELVDITEDALKVKDGIVY